MASQGTSNGRGLDRWVDPALLPTGGGLSGAESRSSCVRRRFRNVLFFAGLDDGPVPRRVLERALGLARANEARLTLIDVVREPELFREILPPEGLARVRRDRRRSLDRLAAAAQEWGVETETEVAAGRTVSEICREVQRCEHDLVMTQGGRELGAGGIDRTTMHLMRKCPCAIWVVRPHTGDRHARVLAAIGPNATNPEEDSLNRRVMELAVSMAECERGEVHVVHVCDPGTPAGSPAGEATTRGELEKRLDEFLAEYELGPGSRAHFVAGRPAIAIPKLVSEEQIDLLVMGTACRTGVRGFFIGNTAERVLERVDCSLLTVKPDGFVSPIRLPGFSMSDRTLADRGAR